MTEKQKDKTEQSFKGQLGGARPGAGRPKGSMNEDTKERMAAKKRFIQRVNKNADRLFNAQLALAKGTTILFRIDTDDKGRKQKPVIVKDEEEIMAYLDGELEDDNESYYYLATERPDNRAIDSMLSRSFGKPEERVDITSGDEPIQPVIIYDLTKQNEDKQETAEPTGGSEDSSPEGDQ